MANIILTQPQGVVGVPGTTSEIIIPDVGSAPNNVVVADTSEFIAVKWIYSLIDEITGETLAAEILAIRRDGSPADSIYNQYSIVGDRLKHTVEVKNIGSVLSFEITNLHINQLKSGITQLQVGSP